MLIDSHAHLFLDNFKNDLDEVIQRAKNAGVGNIIVPATDIPTSKLAIALADKYDFIYAAVGVHPHDSKDWDDNFIDEIRTLASHPKVVAIGEIGLDYFYDFSPREKQLAAFETQIKLALELEKPIIIHNRESNDDIMEFARKYKTTALKAQYHCFAGTVENARELVEMDTLFLLPET